MARFNFQSVLSPGTTEPSSGMGGQLGQMRQQLGAMPPGSQPRGMPLGVGGMPLNYGPENVFPGPGQPRSMSPGMGQGAMPPGAERLLGQVQQLLSGTRQGAMFPGMGASLEQMQQYGQAAAAGGRPQNQSTMQQQTMPAGGGGALPRPPGTTDAQYQAMLAATRHQMEQRDRQRAADRANSASQRSQSIFYDRPGIDLKRRGSPQPQPAMPFTSMPQPTLRSGPGLQPAGGGALPRPPGTTDTQYQGMLNANPLPLGAAGGRPQPQPAMAKGGSTGSRSSKPFFDKPTGLASM